MNYKITGKDIRKKLVGHYSSYIAVLLIIAFILTFCTVFCGTQLEWTHPLSIIGILTLSITFVIFLIILFKIIKLKNHRVFRRYGSAELIAESINQGMKNPRCIIRNRTNPFVFIITDKFIVSTDIFMNYLELNDARYAQCAVTPEIQPVVLTGNPVVSAAATAGVNYASKKLSNSPTFDYLFIWDDENVKHQYCIRRDEMAHAMQVLTEVAPHIEIKEKRAL